MAYIGVTDFAKHFGISRQAVRFNILSGYIPAIKITRYWIIDKEQLKKYEIKNKGRKRWLIRLKQK